VIFCVFSNAQPGYAHKKAGRLSFAAQFFTLYTCAPRATPAEASMVVSLELRLSRGSSSLLVSHRIAPQKSRKA
jgi:hypothetical protein